MRSPRFSLTPGKRGWYKRIDGRTRWICSLSVAPTATEADEHFRRHFAKLTEPVQAERLTLYDVAKIWLADRQAQVDAGMLSPRTLQGDRQTMRMLFTILSDRLRIGDDGPDHYGKVMTRLRGLSTSRIANHVNAIRGMRRWAWEMGYGEEPRFGPTFTAPTARQRRIERAAKPEAADYTPAEVRAMLELATGDMRAWILLAVNAGLGNSDVVRIEGRHVQGDRLVMPRGKTGTPRSVPLWPETIAALPKRDGLLFPTRTGKPLETGTRHGVIAERFRRFCTQNGLPYRGFYGLRRTFATIAIEVGELWLVEEMMGHVSAERSMTRRYIQRLRAEKMLAVSDHVRAQIFPTGTRITR